MGDHYERVYDVGLLDDLHNYFPGLLYEPDRFRTVSDVLGYVRQNTSRRFNLFDYGARQYQQQNTRVPQNTFTRQVPIIPRWTPPAVPVVAQPPQYEFDLTNEVDLAILSPLLRSLDRLIGIAPPTIAHQPVQRVVGGNRVASLFQDVIIHASQELIDNSSTMRILSMDLEESCSVCQDRMRQGENIRRLNACQHEFHGACVDNWLLQRSVLCPVCRHDIRDATQAIRSPRLGSVANTLSHAQSIPPLVSNEENDTDEETIADENTSNLRPRSDINTMFRRSLE